MYGTYRRTSSVNFWRIEALGIEKNPNLHLIEYDLTDQAASIHMVSRIMPDEIYNLAAQSFVGVSFDTNMNEHIQCLWMILLGCFGIPAHSFDIISLNTFTSIIHFSQFVLRLSISFIYLL